MKPLNSSARLAVNSISCCQLRLSHLGSSRFDSVPIQRVSTKCFPATKICSVTVARELSAAILARGPFPLAFRALCVLHFSYCEKQSLLSICDRIIRCRIAVKVKTPLCAHPGGQPSSKPVTKNQATSQWASKLVETEVTGRGKRGAASRLATKETGKTVGRIWNQ